MGCKSMAISVVLILGLTGCGDSSSPTSPAAANDGYGRNGTADSAFDLGTLGCDESIEAQPCLGESDSADFFTVQVTDEWNCTQEVRVGITAPPDTECVLDYRYCFDSDCPDLSETIPFVGSMDMTLNLASQGIITLDDGVLCIEISRSSDREVEYSLTISR